MEILLGLSEEHINCGSCETIDGFLVSNYFYNKGVNVFSDFKNFSKAEKDDLNKYYKKVINYYEKYEDKLPEILFGYSALLSKTNVYSQIKLTNDLESYFNENFDGLSSFQKHQIAGIYAHNINIMWEKEDWRNGIKSTEKLIEILDYKNAKDNRGLGILYSRSPADAYRNLWAMNFNIKPVGNKNNRCDYLLRASQLDPERYYDTYLKECN